MKAVGLAIGTLLIVLLLGAAAVVAGRLLEPPAEAAVPGAGQRQMVLSHDDGSGPVQVRITTQPAPELPDRPSDAGGVFVRREDDAIVVGTGAIEVDVNITGDAEPQLTVRSDGPEVEVLVTRDTQVYEDVTDLDAVLSEASGGDKTVQQVVRPVESAEGIGKNTEVQVWGQQRGDRIVADVIVFRKVRF